MTSAISATDAANLPLQRGPAYKPRFADEEPERVKPVCSTLLERSTSAVGGRI